MASAAPVSAFMATLDPDERATLETVVEESCSEGSDDDGEDVVTLSQESSIPLSSAVPVTVEDVKLDPELQTWRAGREAALTSNSDKVAAQRILNKNPSTARGYKKGQKMWFVSILSFSFCRRLF